MGTVFWNAMSVLLGYCILNDKTVNAIRLCETVDKMNKADIALVDYHLFGPLKWHFIWSSFTQLRLLFSKCKDSFNNLIPCTFEIYMWKGSMVVLIHHVVFILKWTCWISSCLYLTFWTSFVLFWLVNLSCIWCK